MKSFEQLAENAYEAASKTADPDFRNDARWPSFDELSTPEQARWIAVAKQLWAEFAAMH